MIAAHIRLILRSGPQDRVSKDVAASSFETRTSRCAPQDEAD